MPKTASNRQTKLLFLLALCICFLLIYLLFQLLINFIFQIFLPNLANQTLWLALRNTFVLVLTISTFIAPSLLFTFCKQKTQKLIIPVMLQDLAFTTPSELGVDRYPTFIDIGLAPIGYLAYLALANIAAIFTNKISWLRLEEVSVFTTFVTSLERFCAIILITILNPFLEELLLRGWLYGKLREKFNSGISIFINTILATVISSILTYFFYHTFTIDYRVFCFSLILCCLREFTGTIWSGVLAHALANIILYYSSYTFGNVIQ